MQHIFPICYYDFSYALACDSAGVTARSRVRDVTGFDNGMRDCNVIVNYVTYSEL